VDKDSKYSAGNGITLTANRFSVDTGTVQSRVSGSCSSGNSIRAIASNGTVTCESAAGGGTLADNSVTTSKILDGTITATDVNSNSVQSRVSGSCSSGNSIRAIASNGTVTCESDDSGIATESDPQVGSLSNSSVPRWNGSQLVNGLLRDNGQNVGIGTSAPLSRLHVVGNNIQIPIITGRPSTADCNNESETGRIVLSSGKDNYHIYVCAAGVFPSGWVGFAGVFIDTIG
jgi:hypothetical protein